MFDDDDDVDTLFAYRLLATEVGMVVEVAHDGHEASTLANLVVPDAIVLDLGLRSRGRLDGHEVPRRLRANAPTSAIPILVVSGYDSDRDRAEAKACGYDAILPKPCSAEDLLRLVTKLATGHRNRAEARKSGSGDATA